VALILAMAQSAGLLVRLAAGDPFPGWSLYAGPALGALLWPGVSWLLLAPQRRLEREHTI
jgi:rod shape-determining protein MreD